MDKYNFDLVVFCHLRWEFVTQRPQHIISRIAKHHKVLFVEEAIEFTSANKGTANIINPEKNITVLQPRIDQENYANEVAPIIKEQLQILKLRRNPVIWFYSGSFYEVLKHLDNYQLVIYDCMDELSAFLGAPKDLIQEEKNLLNMANVVFTGGRSLYESKSRFSNDVYCFPSSVDKEHFEKALNKSTKIPSDIKKIKKPIVGYYGVIDERIDTKLLSDAAKKLPDVAFVMIGPVVKIREIDLPKASNIHFLGGKSYKELPSYLKAFDIAMMPFALNASTKFISPTKTLEYMAAKKPIISTAIFDVVRTFVNKEVKVAADTNEFIDDIKAFLIEPKVSRIAREKAQEDFLLKTSWDKTVNEMIKIISQHLIGLLSTTRKVQLITARTA